MNGNQIYQHPDGHAIDLLNGMLTVTNSDGQTASVPIGEIGLTELGERMVSIGQALTTTKHSTECAGAVMEHDLLNELLALRGKPQSEAFQAIHEKLCAFPSWSRSTVLQAALRESWSTCWKLALPICPSSSRRCAKC